MADHESCESRAELSKIGSLLRNNDIKFVRLTWCDTAGVVRAKANHIRLFENIATDGFGLCTGVESLPVMYDVPSEGSGIGPVGEVRLIPKWDTLELLPYSKGHARVFVDLYERATNKPSELCPRDFLRRAVANAAKEGIYVNAAFENEFLLLRPDESDKGYKLVDDTVYCATFSMDLHHEVVSDICDALTKQGILVETYMVESAPGQQEISMKYNEPMKAACQQVIFKETVKAVAHKHGYIATFVPKVIADQAGNGTHIHFSLNDKDGRNLTPSADKPNEVSELMGHFIAGILDHLPALMAITTGTTNSLRRVVPRAWSGSYRCWGYENREAAVRVPFNASGAVNPTHVELKSNDSTSNPFLALGALITAGMDGVKRKLPLPPNTDYDPGTASEELLKKNNIEILPRTMDAVISALEKDKVLLDALQPRLAKAFIAVRKAEYCFMKDMSLEQEVKLLLNRY